MTEADWLAGADPHRAMVWVRESGKVSDRRLRLFATAYCRRYRNVFDDPRSRKAVEIAELYADGLATEIQRKEAHRNARKVASDRMQEGDWSWEPWIVASVASDHIGSWYAIVGAADFSATQTASSEPSGPGGISPTHLIWCIFVNPFRPVAFDPRWRTADVVGLARGIYEDRAFDRLPLLADALMDAGCAEEQLLAHCRSDGPHVRGCWAVDLVLGKE
jgi:hypothetical protein